MHVDALAGDADLAGVEQGAARDEGDHLGEVDVLAHDARVVAGQLEDHLLEGLGAVLQDPLADGDGAREADVVDPRVQGHLLAELGAAVEDLEHAGREDGLGELAELEQGVGGEGGGLDDDAVARGQRGDDLDDGEDHGEVPGRDGAEDADRLVRAVDLDGVVFVLELVLQCHVPFIVKLVYLFTTRIG